MPSRLLSIAILITTTLSAAATFKGLPRRGGIESENLRRALGYALAVRDSAPVLCLVSADARSDVADLVSDYAAVEALASSYRVTRSGLSRRHAWQSRVGLTWILVADDADALDEYAHRHRHIWNANNRYLMIVAGRDVASPSLELFRGIWREYSVHGIVAVAQRGGFRCLSKYLPFEMDRSGDYGVVREVCPTDGDDEVLYEWPERLNGYTIRVIVFPSLMMNVTLQDGELRFSKLDANAMSLLERGMDARFLVKVIEHVGRNDPFHLTLRSLESGHSEMIVTSFFLNKYNNFRMYEFTVSLYEDKVCLIAPAAGFRPKSYMPILPFTPELWAALALCNLLVSVLWHLVGYYSQSFRRRRRDGVVLLPLMTTRGVAPRANHVLHPHVSSCCDLAETWCYPLKEESGGTAAQRAFLLGTLFFGVIVTGLYNSCLVSNLSKPFRYPELNTLQEVADSNLTILSKYYNLLQSTFTENTSLTNRLRSKLKLFSSHLSSKDMVALGKNIALSRYASFKLDNLSMYYDENGNELLHMVEECPTTSLLSYVVRLHSPYRERMNNLLLRMQQAGLINLWYENMTYPVYADEQRRKAARSDWRRRLTVEHYSLTFLGLILGLLACVAVFLVELYVARRAAGRRRRRESGSAVPLPHYYALARATELPGTP